MDFPALLIAQGGQDLFGFRVDNLAGRRKCKSAIDAEGNPSRLFAKVNAISLAWWHNRSIEDVQPAVSGVADPDFFLIRSETNAMAGTAMPLGPPRLVILDFHTIEHLAQGQVPDLESQ